MNNKELNEYIKHYLEKDKTRSAIMLTAPWGTGKSYYIQNELIPFLQKEKENCCIALSLHGLKDISEISKNIYLEIRLKKMQRASEKTTATKIIGKTVAKGISSFFGIDLSLSEDDLSKLFESIDLSGKLVILEDIERTSIDLFDLFGYINNLVEQDGVKVLLIANEEEILKYEENQKNEKALINNTFSSKLNEFQEKTPTKDTFEYLRKKEKTISDTIKYKNDYESAIINIIKQFNDEKLNKFCNAEFAKKIGTFIGIEKSINLRSFLFACQKTVDLFKYISNENDDNLLECIFCGNIIFSLNMKNGVIPKWVGNDYISYNLGNSLYPLFKFSFEFITKQEVDIETIKNASSMLNDIRKYETTYVKFDEDVAIISTFDCQTEKAIIEAINNIENRLSDPNNIQIFHYGTIANCLICISQYIECDISKCLKLLAENLHGLSGKVDPYYLFHSSIKIENEERQAQYEKQKDEMIASLNYNRNYFDFDYTTNSINQFIANLEGKKGNLLNDGAFLSKLNIEKFAKLIFKCSAQQIKDFRILFNYIYNSINIRDYLSNDKKSIDSLIEMIETHTIPKEFDKIQTMQKNWFINNLKEYSRLLS